MSLAYVDCMMTLASSNQPVVDEFMNLGGYVVNLNASWG
jgi:hypothetical protein